MQKIIKHVLFIQLIVVIVGFEIIVRMCYKVSIVLPVYNVVKYVRTCMDSLRVQTLSGIEVIFVDDWGTDDSINIIQDYISEYNLEKDWHIFKTPFNQGPALARNIGIREARGKYVAFVDADDWIESDMMQTLYLMAEKNNAHIASSAAVKEYPDGSQSVMLNPYVGDGILTQRKRRYLLSRYVSNFTTMIFDREWLLQYDLCFPNAKSCEDSSFVGQCYLVAERITQINKPFYHYIIYPQSISHRKGVFRGKDKHKAIFAMFKFAKIHNLYSSYWWVLWWVYLKKVVVLSIVDYIKK